MTWRKWLKRVAMAIGGIVLGAAILVGAVWMYLHPGFTRTNGVGYGIRNGRPVTLDVFRPSQPNGYAVALMNSGGWKSGGAGSVPGWLCAPLLRRGYTVFAISHISQPEGTVQEAFEDMQRGVRFIRAHAAEYGVRADRIGVTGGSAGGHLSLMLATRGGPGRADAADPVERESSAVQAVAIFYPVTDLVDLGTSTENLHDGGVPKSFSKAFGPTVTNLVAWTNIARALSPVYHVTGNLPPTLIHHGLADTLTPPEQSEKFRQRALEIGRTVEVVWHPGKKHGWLTMFWELRHFADWFDRYLPEGKAAPRTGAGEVAR